MEDRYGCCVICHKNMLIEEVIDQKVQKRFTAEYTEAEFLLNDGSKMRVALCTGCKATLDSVKPETIMNTVKKGWAKEVGESTWDQEKKKKHLERYNKLEIITRSENKPKDVLEKHLKEYKEKELKNGTHH